MEVNKVIVLHIGSCGAMWHRFVDEKLKLSSVEVIDMMTDMQPCMARETWGNVNFVSQTTLWKQNYIPDKASFCI